MKKSLWKRVLALVLCLALSAGYLPVPSFAEEPEEPVALQQEEPVEEPEKEAEETQEPTTEPTTEPTEEPTEATTEEPTEATTEATEATTEATTEPTKEATEAPELPEESTEAPQEELMEEVYEGVKLNDGEVVAYISKTPYYSLQDALNVVGKSDYPTYITLMADIGEGTYTLRANTCLNLHGHSIQGELKLSESTDMVEPSIYNCYEYELEPEKFDGNEDPIDDIAPATVASFVLESSSRVHVNSSSVASRITVKHAVQKDGILFNAGSSLIQDLTLEGGIVRNSGTIQCLTIIPSETETTLDYFGSNGIYEKIQIHSNTKLESLELSSFVSNCLRRKSDDQPVSAKEVLESGTYNAEENDYVYSIDIPVYAAESHAYDSTGQCPCGSRMQASLDGTLYADFSDAVRAAMKKDGSTVTLMTDVSASYLFSSEDSNYTIDWNGHTLEGCKLQMCSGTVTLKDSVGGGGMSRWFTAPIVLVGGTLTILGGRYVCTSEDEPIYGDRSCLTLPAGYVFYNDAGNVVDWKKDGFGENYAVTCKPHAVHAAPGEDGLCICGLPIAASVTNGDQVVGYPTLKEALAAADQAPGSTLTLFQDAENAQEAISSGTFTIDWNGHSLTGNSQLTIQGGTVTLKGTGGVENADGSALNIQGGTVAIQSGSYAKAILGKDAKVSLSGGSFGQIQLESAKALEPETFRTAFAAEGYYLYGASGTPVSAVEVLAGVHGTYTYTISGPVTVQRHTHSYDPNTNLCSCGLTAEAKVGDTFYDDLQTALNNSSVAGNGKAAILLKDVKGDYSLSHGRWLLLNGHNIQGTLSQYSGESYVWDEAGVSTISAIRVSGSESKLQLRGGYKNAVGSLFLNGGSVVNYGFEIQDAMVYGGTLENTGTIENLTFCMMPNFSLNHPKLKDRSSTYNYNNVRIVSKTQLKTLDLFEFAEESYCFTMDGKPISAVEVRKTESKEMFDDYFDECYFYSFGNDPIKLSREHTFEPGSTQCPCGYLAEATLDGVAYTKFDDAKDRMSNGHTLKLLKDVDYGENGIACFVSGGTYDWNGHTLKGLRMQPSGEDTRLILKDSAGGGGMRMEDSECLNIQGGIVTIESGSYWGASPIKVDASAKLIIPDGNVVYDNNKSQIVNWKTDGFRGHYNLTVKPHDPHTPDETTGDCICGLTFEASVTAGDKTTYYATLQEAVTAATETSGTVKLARDLENATLSSGTATIDWNGHNVTALTVTGGTLTLTGTGGVNGTTEKALDIQGGSVTIQSGSYNNVSVGENATLTASGGTFTGAEGVRPVTFQIVGNEETGYRTTFTTAVGYAVYAGNGDYMSDAWKTNDFAAGSSIQVKLCKNHYVNEETGECLNCGTQFVAKLGVDGYYTDFEKALSDAQETTGSTLKLLRDTERQNTLFIKKGTFTIDWNGYTLWHSNSYLQGGSVTMLTSREGGGINKRSGYFYLEKDASLTIKSGSYFGIRAFGNATLDIQGGTFEGEENTLFPENSDVPLSMESTVTVKTPEHYVFYDQDGNVVSDWRTNGFAKGSTVTLKRHEVHTPDENGKCVCGYQGAAMVRVESWFADEPYTEICYDTFEKALAAVKTASGRSITLTLWKDVTLNGSETVSANYPLTIDWNGKTLTNPGGLYLNPNNSNVVTLKDSKGTGKLDAVLKLSGSSHIESGNYYGVDEQYDNVETKISGGTFHSRGTGAARYAPITFNNGTKITLTGDNAYWANGEVIPQDDVQFQDEVTVKSHDHQAENCPCGRSYAATVTVGDQQTMYSTLAEAVENIQSGCTLKLMSDGTLESDPSTWDFTLDLGGCTLDTDGHNPNPNYQTTFTLKDSVGGGVLKLGADGTGRIKLMNFGTMMLESGTVAGDIEVSQSNNLTISDGTVTGKVDPYMGNLTVTGGNIGTLGSAYATAKVTLHGGTYGKLENCSRYMLEDGYALYDAEGNVVNIGKPDIQNVTIKEHIHDYTNGICPCGGVNSGEGLDMLKPDDYDETLQILGYQVNGEEVYLQSRTWGGKEYLSREDGKPLKNAIVQTYTWGENSVNESYPTGTNVYRVVETEDHVLELQKETALENLLIYRGASVRCTGVNGIRIITGMTKDNKNALTSNNQDGFTLVQVGTVAAWVCEMKGDNFLTLGKRFARSGSAYRKDVKDDIYKDTGNELQYTNVLIDFPEDWCGKPLALRSFAILEKDGVQYTIYGGQVSRTISGIAQQVLADKNISLTPEEKTYVQQLVSYGEGSNE